MDIPFCTHDGCVCLYICSPYRLFIVKFHRVICPVLIQIVFKTVYTWCTYYLLWQSIPYWCNSLREKVFSHFFDLVMYNCLGCPLFVLQFDTLSFRNSNLGIALSSYIPFAILYVSIMSPRCLL